MTHEEKNQRIAQWLGWKSNGYTRWHSPACQRDEEHCGGKVPDFYASAEANDLILEKLPYVALTFSEINKWSVSWSNGVDRSIIRQFTNRKEAVAEAALKLIESETV